MSNWYKTALGNERYFIGSINFKVFVPRTEDALQDEFAASEKVNQIGISLIKQGIDVTNTDVSSMESQ